MLAGTAVPFEYNSLDSLSNTLKQCQGKVACIIMEATRKKHPEPGYLEGVRELADQHDVLLIFDEVITGFRMAAGGAQEYYGVTPDLATFGKAIANGYPLAAVAGKGEIMASQSDNFISSTYWSDTTALAAGVATLTEIKQKPVIETLDSNGEMLIAGLRESAAKHGVRMTVEGHNCHFVTSFDYGELTGKVATLFMQEMIVRGVYTLGYFYMCFTHTADDLAKILAAADETLAIIAKAEASDSVDDYLKCRERYVGFRRLV